MQERQGPPKSFRKEGGHWASPDLSKVGCSDLARTSSACRGGHVASDFCRWQGRPAWLCLLERFWGEKRRGSGVNEMNSRLQTGPPGGCPRRAPSPAPAQEICPRPDQGGVREPQTVHGRPAVRAPAEVGQPHPCRIKGTCNGLKIKNVN